MSSRRRFRKKHCSSSSDEYDTEDEKPSKVQRTQSRQHGNSVAVETPGLRRPVWFWSEFNQWWRRELERLGKRPGKPSIVQWYEDNAERVWPHDTPSFQETRLHAKCLRSTEAVRDYFRRYRAARKHEQGGGKSEPAPVAPTKPERHCSARLPAPPQEEPPMDPVALIAQHNARIAEIQAQQAQAQAQHAHHNRPMLLLRPCGGGGGPPPVATASVCSFAGAGADARGAAFRGSSGGGSASCAWNEHPALAEAEDVGHGATPGWRRAAPSRSLESGGLYSQVSAMDCSPMRGAARGSGGGAADMRTPFHAPPTPMSMYTAAPSPFRPPPTPMSGYRAAPSLLTPCTMPMRAPPAGISRDWFAGRSDGGADGAVGGGRARVLTWDEAAADGAGCGLQQEQQEQEQQQQVPGGEKRRSDRSSATDDGAGSSSMHLGGHEGEGAGSGCDGSETETETESETETDNDDGDDNDDAREGCWARQQPLRRVDTPFWGRRAKSLMTHLTTIEHQQHFEQEQQQQPRPTGLPGGGAMSRQLPPPLQLPVGDAMLTSPLPYMLYTGADNNNNSNNSDIAWRGAPPLVRCGDQMGLALLLRQQKQQQRELVLREQAMGRADSLSPGSLLITAPALPIMPLREDDWTVSPGAGVPLGHDSAQQQKLQQRQRPQQPQQLIAAAADGGMARIDEGTEGMEGDGEEEDDDEGVPEVFWDD